MKKSGANRRINILLILSLVFAICVVAFGGLKEVENEQIINIVITMSVTMAGFGLVAFQVAHASDELKKDFIESSIIMILSTLTGFFYLVYPARSLDLFSFNVNFGEASIFLFFWAFILFLVVLVDRRFDFLK
jgi:hypothetical protein